MRGQENDVIVIRYRIGNCCRAVIIEVDLMHDSRQIFKRHNIKNCILIIAASVSE